MSAPRRKLYTITAPLNDTAAYRIDANFDAIFEAVAQATSGVLPVASGGTGQQSYSKGDLLYADTQVTLAGLHDVAVGNVLLSGGVGVKPQYGKVALSGSVTHITGILPATFGGTGFGSYAVGDLLYASTTTALSKLADVATGNALISGGVSTAPSWGKIGLTSHVSGVLPEANGGTNQSTYTTGDILYASAANTLSKLADVATGNALISGGVGVAPSWGKIGLTTHVSGVLPIANGGTNLSSYSQGDLIYASAANVLSALAKDTNATRYLSNTGTSNAPAWAQVSLTQGVTGTLPVTNGGTGLSSLSQGDIIYGSAANTFSALAKSTTASRYVSNTGTSNNPAWAQVDLTNGVTGTLPATSGGTGLSSLAQGDILYASAANTLSALAKNTSSSRYLSNTGSSNNPAWSLVDLSNGVTNTLGVSNGGTGIPAYAVGDILYASGLTTLSALPKSSSSTRYLSNTGASNVPAWAQVNLTNGVTGTLAQGNGGTNSTDGSIASSTGVIDVLGLRATGSPTFASGSGMELSWVSATPQALIRSIDRGADDHKQLQFIAKNFVVTLTSGGAGTGIGGFTFDNTNGLIPTSDNTWNLGDATHRWKLVRGVTVTSGDLQFDNGWTITEHDKLNISEPGLAFLDENDDLVAFVGRGGFRNINSLTWTKKTHAQRTLGVRH